MNERVSQSDRASIAFAAYKLALKDARLYGGYDYTLGEKILRARENALKVGVPLFDIEDHNLGTLSTDNPNDLAHELEVIIVMGELSEDEIEELEKKYLVKV